MIRWILAGIVATGRVLTASASELELPEAKITVHVVDMASRPLSGIDVAVTFEKPNYKPGVWGSSEMSTLRGRSDAEGFFSATARSGNYVGYDAKAVGYYPSTGKPIEFLRSTDGRWQPWDSTVELALKKVINPIPMYARRIEREMPILDRSIGFDLVEADWVIPHGKGKAPDIFLKVTKRVQSFHDFGAELSVSFPNNGDGILSMPQDRRSGSQLRSPHQAPEEGFDNFLSLLQGNSKERGVYGMAGGEQNYFLRLRTLLDEHGKIVSCLYGKVYGLEYFPVSSKTAKIRFRYFLNPNANDRNIEFDPNRNLFTILSSDEQIKAP